MRLRIDAAKLEQFRAVQGLLKREVAARANIHPNQITRILAGEPVGVRVDRDLARVMGMPVSEITAEVVEIDVAVGRDKALAV